ASSSGVCSFRSVPNVFAAGRGSCLQQRSPGSREFYVKAKKNLWQQALALCIVGWTVIFIIAVRHLTQDERSTPIITWTVQSLNLAGSGWRH
ncbi:unnamed protein product, partial [Ectocarpus sp. 12 AP-2014]